MPPKRKLCDENLTDSIASPPQKRLKPAPSSLQRNALNVTTGNRHTSVPAQNLKHKISFTPASSARLSRSKRADPSLSRLHPCGERKTAKVGHKDESLLRMLCEDTETGETKELHFRNLTHSNIDWNNAQHIRKINNWRNQLYGRAGMKTKEVAMWLPDEDLWFELFWHLSIAESRRHGLLVPKACLVMDAFNDTFVGNVIKDLRGEDTAPREQRGHNAFASKLSRVCSHLRERLHHSSFGKSGDVFVPKITLGILHAYKAMKEEMKEQGIEQESPYSDHLEQWCNLFANLPEPERFNMQKKEHLDVEYQKEQGETEAAERRRQEELDAATALMDMANSSVNSQRPVTPVSKMDITFLIASPD